MLYEDFCSTLGTDPSHRVFDVRRPAADQFAGIKIVVEAG